MDITAVVFWCSVLLLAYTYAGYPLLLALWPKRRAEEPPRHHQPTLCIIVSVYNEKRYVLEKIRNSLKAVGARGQVIVISDGSDDGTTELAGSVRDNRLLVLRNSVRRGKAYSLRKAMPHVQADISVFTDANVFFRPGAMRRLTEPFADPACGAVSGKVALVALDDGEPLGEGMYMRYERFLLRAESRLGTMVGADGGMLAVRTALVPDFPPGLVLDDLFIVVKVIEAGYAVRYQPRAQGSEPVPARVEQEFRRKVRIAAGGFQLLRHLALVRAPWRWPLPAAMFFSHKILRWVSGLFMVTALLANIALASASVGYALLLGVQGAAWAMGIIAWIAAPLRGNMFFYPIYYFGAMNLASLVGLWKTIMGSQSGVWQRVDR
jgi:biofilm PGA synthesis N-glycosyltransferase PgaC